jgi:hypothetical protein
VSQACRLLRILSLLGACLGGAQGWAAAPEMSLRAIGLDRPSSFPTLLWVHVQNLAFTPVDLGELIASSALLIDGKPASRGQAPFEGPAGIPARGDWEGCLAFEDYTPVPPAGRHRVSLRMGGTQTREIMVAQAPPLDWRKGNLKTRFAEVRALAAVLEKGLPRTCVERWLTLRDGGEGARNEARYFLEPQFKVAVPYAASGELGRETEVVAGPAQVYEEPFFAD